MMNHDDGAYQQDIQHYSLDELADIAEHIDRSQFPERFQMVVNEMHARQASSQFIEPKYPLLADWRTYAVLMILASSLGVLVFLKIPALIEQRHVLRDIHALAHTRILSIGVIAGYQPNKYREKTWLSDEQIQDVQQSFKTADIVRVGGHNHPRYECILTITLDTGQEREFLGVVYGEYVWNINDLYLSPIDANTTKSFQYRGHPVHITGLGQWIIERGPPR